MPILSIGQQCTLTLLYFPILLKLKKYIMETQQSTWIDSRWTIAGSKQSPNEIILAKAQLVLVFGASAWDDSHHCLKKLQEMYPLATIAGCSTAGEIFGVSVQDDTFVATAIEFASTEVQLSSIKLAEVNNQSVTAGIALGKRLDSNGLKHVLIFSDGLGVNGSDLVKGLEQQLGSEVTITGGLAGDGDRFENTWVVESGAIVSDTVTAVGLYGSDLLVGHASMGGWDTFGPERIVTRSEGNVLYELDGKSALELYKEYLGDHASELPASGLLYPLTVKRSVEETPVVRTILAIDEELGSMTFAGDIPQGAHSQLMKANFDRLIDGAHGAAEYSVEQGQFKPELALLISCVGRKMVLQQRVEEEVEAVQEVYGNGTTLAGFYSYGEISPFKVGEPCALHNQTMTVTAFAEVPRG